jgi:D-amino-acid dehydrogenase
VEIRGLQAAGGDITGVMTSEGQLTADAYVMAMGSYSPLLLKPLGVQIPVFPVKGYSITMPVKDASAAPESTVMDETFKVGITRLGERIRVGGTAELAGYDLRLREERRRPLVRAVTDLFPQGGDLSQTTFWCGLRPMTPDGTPVIGATPYRNLYLNTGHGTLGWTMSCGSARVLADLISGKRPDISLDGLTIDRYA